MKKILLSILTIAVVSAVGVAATRAFFSDTETSSGNTFTAGSIDLQIASQCTYNGVACTPDGNWAYGNGKLTSEKFFNFTDIKPGDWGENTVSFKILTNPAWMCASIARTTTANELSNFVNVFWWVDTNGNNIYETGEKVLFGGPLTLQTLWSGGSPLPLTFADSTRNWKYWPEASTIEPIPALTEQHLGIGWCFGTIGLTGSSSTEAPNGFTCTAGVSGAENAAQGDQIVATLAFTAEQSKNNAAFLCPENRPAATPTPTP